MKNREDYDKAIEIIGAVIRAWDPYGLIANGSPIDEFDAEIAMLTTKVPRIRSIDDAAQAVSIVFSEQFEPEKFSPADCFEPGQEIFIALKQAKLIAVT